MKRMVSILSIFLIILSLASCSISEISFSDSKENPLTPKDKAINYVKNNGEEFGSKVCVAFEDYFLDNYNTYFIVYNSDSDTFSFEYYSADKYFDVPPTSNHSLNNSVTIDLSTGKAKYYSEIGDDVYTGTATIDIESYNKSNDSLSNVIISGKHEQIYNTIEQTFEVSVNNLISNIDLYLFKEESGISVCDFGFTSVT